MPKISISCKGQSRYEAVSHLRFVSRVPHVGELVEFHHPESGEAHVCRVIQVVHHTSIDDLGEGLEVAAIYGVLLGPDEDQYRDGAVGNGETPYIP